jgi:hypothetical protein
VCSHQVHKHYIRSGAGTVLKTNQFLLIERKIQDEQE